MTNLKKNILKVLSTVLVLSFLVTGCVGNNDAEKSTGAGKDGASSSEEILIGGISPMTGENAIYGITATNGATLAFKEINEAGGILGKQVKFEILDDKGDNTEAVNAFNKLVSQDAVAIIGAVTSAPTEAVAQPAVDENMPLLTPTGTQFGLTKDRPNVFRVCYTDPFQGEILAQYTAENLKATKAAVLTNNSSDYSDGIAKAFVEKAKELGVDIVAEESYGKGDTDFRAQLTKIAAESPEVVVIPDYYKEIALISQQAKEVGIEATLIGGDGWDGVVEQLDESSYADVENSVFTNHYSLQDESEKVQNFIEAYKGEFNENPSSFAALGYDAAYLYKEAIEKAGSTDKQAIVDAMKEIDFEGVTGNLKFDENNNPVKSVSMIKIVNGEYTLDSVVAPK
ncbi:ABC transporter substrate-binding protein [Miniphocaeibacter halophilus]|uniref:ABC transporter substrate-binding protein n=1 Tax=Miniphocaeibacter halophilus TaxID=2931922 RepID=UPI001FB52A10|nr:ABC transporter substrate-binding protein [Miniphocaeibacter halophilus]